MMRRRWRRIIYGEEACRQMLAIAISIVALSVAEIFVGPRFRKLECNKPPYALARRY